MAERVFDLLIRGGTVYDGSGGDGRVADVGVTGDRVAEVGDLAEARAGAEMDAAGMAVAPGFINMLSHSYITMLHDGRSLSELTQGVTTQVFGEGYSMGPLREGDRERLQKTEPALDYAVEWDSLAGYLGAAEKQGISQNVCSYIGATTLRQYVANHDDRPLTEREMETVRSLIRDEMAAGALGIGSSLIYPPAFFAKTDELVEMCKAAAPFGGGYISHMRNEGYALLEGIEELITIAREADCPAEIYHLKASGQDAWHLMPKAIERVEEARAAGLAITADMYTYTAGATGLSNVIPPWYHEGGPEKLFERLGDRNLRAEMRTTIETRREGWENLYMGAGSPGNILIQQVRKPENRKYQGKTLAEVGELMGTDPIEALFDLVESDRSRITTAYFMMSEENVKLGLTQPWVAIGSDAGSIAAEGVFLQRSTHPRAYGTFARFLGKYVRDEQVCSLGEAVRRMAALPAGNLGLKDRGTLAPGAFADVVVFDAETIADRATYAEPHQYSVGVRDVVVNGVVTLRDGEFGGKFGGRALTGRGKR